MIIYKIRNKINNKSYIGQTIQSIEKRIKRHFRTKDCPYLNSALHKYGINNFEIIILCRANSIEELNHREQYYIKLFNTLAPNGYNLKEGGKQGGKCSNKVKDNISKALQVYYKSNPGNNKGKKFSKEHCSNMSKVRKGFTSLNRVIANKKVVEKCKKPIKAININTLKEYMFKSVQDCAKSLNLDSSCISRVAHNKQNRKQHSGYRFEYV